MKSIFNVSPALQRGLIIPGAWAQARRGLSRNLLQVMDYYHSRNIATKSSHFLVQLINGVRISYEAPLERFYQLMVTQESAIGQFHKMTSPIYSGGFVEGLFYGKGVQELVVTSNESFDYTHAAKHWKDQEPVKVLTHPKCDLDMHIPNGVSYSAEQGVAVVSVNIPLLMVMYRSFVIEQVLASRAGATPKTTSQFVHTYVLPNMLPTHLDQAIINRFVRLATKTKFEKSERKHVMALADWDSQTDKVLQEIAGVLNSVNMPLYDMLYHIPVVDRTNAFEALAVPQNAPTRQYAWAEAVMRLPTLVAMAVLSPKNLQTFDRGRLQSTLLSMRYSGSVSLIKSKLPGYAGDYETMFDTLDMVIKA